jgi:hypothetical protein
MAKKAKKQIIELDVPITKAAPEGYFCKSQAGEPVFHMKLGDIDVTLPISGIRREFKVDPQSADSRMLDLVAKALVFVTVLRVGDALPTEVLTGEPSWTITGDHRLRAYQRLTLQLATWLTGEERVFTSSEELSQIAEDPNNKKKWNEAFDEAAKRLGFKENGREQVVNLVQSLAEEIAYIEALRDHYDRIEGVTQRIQHLRKIYSRENSVREIADSVARLMTRAQTLLQESFHEIDGQTGEILSVLKSPGAQVKYIRKARDQLYCRMFAWKEMLTRWDEAPRDRDPGNVVLLRDMYRFLATRYMPAMDWLLYSKLSNEREKAKAKTSVVW